MTSHSRKPHDEIKILRPSGLFSSEQWIDRCAILDDRHYLMIYKKKVCYFCREEVFKGKLMGFRNFKNWAIC